MRSLFLYPFLLLAFSSCSSSPDVSLEPKEEVVTIEDSPINEPLNIPTNEEGEFTFAVPDSSSELMTEENKKTVIGPAPTPHDESEESGAIHVTPPPASSNSELTPE